jgi:hypothetical protein
MFRPGNVDEKLRTEAATYIWLQSNCPNIPVPRLFGFGFPGTQSVLDNHLGSKQHIDISTDRDLITVYSA